MDKKILSKITRVAKENRRGKTKQGVKIIWSYWFGYYQEKGKGVQVYLGKDLPKELYGLLKTRIKPPGHRNYVWPGRKG